MPMTPLNGDAGSVAEINALVDKLRRRSAKFVPYVHQDHGGVRAPVLSLLRDPGKATQKTDYSAQATRTRRPAGSANSWPRPG